MEQIKDGKLVLIRVTEESPDDYGESYRKNSATLHVPNREQPASHIVLVPKEELGTPLGVNQHKLSRSLASTVPCFPLLCILRIFENRSGNYRNIVVL